MVEVQWKVMKTQKRKCIMLSPINAILLVSRFPAVASNNFYALDLPIYDTLDGEFMNPHLPKSWHSFTHPPLRMQVTMYGKKGTQTPLHRDYMALKTVIYVISGCKKIYNWR